MRVALAQIAPCFLDREGTIRKVVEAIGEASGQGASLVVFGEALVPGYPVWLDRTDGARFDSDLQKRFHARYLANGVDIEGGDLDEVCAAARERSIGVILGVMERPSDRGGHSLFCSCVMILADGTIACVHRKLMPTYEERLCWSAGDGGGLRTTRIGEFTVGALNCWENWMPLARAALQAQGENLHVMIWPGSVSNTSDITRFAAREGRSFVVSVCGLLREEDLPEDLPARELIAEKGELILEGGSCVCGPDASWLLEPVAGEEFVRCVDIDMGEVLRERQNFDPAGHYARPDVLRLEVNRLRMASAVFLDGGTAADGGGVE
ncbi:MAG: carbon-nitrogen hydrolase family protein [Planctomycetota bacterium]|jgi:nitrilase